jgi:seryl-tRNA synthetase
MCSPELLRDLSALQNKLGTWTTIHLNQIWGEVAAVKAHRNRLSDKIPGMKKSGQDVSQLIAETKEMRVQIQELEKAAEEYDSRLNAILVGIPNVPDASVPPGRSSEDNVEVRRWGTPPTRVLAGSGTCGTRG